MVKMLTYRAKEKIAKIGKALLTGFIVRRCYLSVYHALVASFASYRQYQHTFSNNALLYIALVLWWIAN